jgi:hypothetical protein
MGEVAVVEDAATAAPAPAAEDGMRMEGWLYLIRSNRFGLHYSHKRYFVLEDAALRCYKAPPASKREVNSNASSVRFLLFRLRIPAKFSCHSMGGGVANWAVRYDGDLFWCSN